MQKLMTFAAFIAVAIFLGTLIYTVPKAADSSNEPAPPTKTTPADPDGKSPDTHPNELDSADGETANGDTKPAASETTESDSDKTDKPAEPVKPAQPLLPTVEPLEVDGGDVAAFLNLRLAKFRIHVPEGKYTVHVWAERWRRGNDKAEEIVLSEFSTEVDAVDIVAQLPTESAPEDGFLRVNAYVTRPRKPAVPTGAWYEELKKPTPFDLGNDLHMLTYTWNAEGSATGGLKDVHADHDLTIYLKARVIPGDFTPFKKPEAAPEGAPETNAPLTAPDTDIE